jgi:hypothetical protein
VWGQRNGGWNDYEAMRERRRGLMRMLRDWEEKGREENGWKRRVELEWEEEVIDAVEAQEERDAVEDLKAVWKERRVRRSQERAEARRRQERRREEGWGH